MGKGQKLQERNWLKKEEEKDTREGRSDGIILEVGRETEAG